MTPLNSLLTALVAGIILWALFRPGSGWFWQWRLSRGITARVRREDALKHLHEGEYQTQPATVQTLAGVLGISVGEATELVGELIDHGFVRPAGNAFVLTVEGRSYALQVVRAHRLWERYLADETDVKEEEIHIRAEREEHNLSPAEADELEARLGHPASDPHGDLIPTSDGEIAELEGMVLTRWPIDTPGRIVHLEDEPPEVFAQLVAEGFRLGEDVRIMERTDEHIRFFTRDREFVVASVVAANITVAPLPEVNAVEGPFMLLSDLERGEESVVIGIGDGCRGLTRRRLLDLGFTPGARVEMERIGPFGDPRAYKVRGTLVALRHEQADHILIEPTVHAADREDDV